MEFSGLSVFSSLHGLAGEFMVSSSVTVASFPGAIDAVYHRSRWPCGNLRARHIYYKYMYIFYEGETFRTNISLYLHQFLSSQNPIMVDSHCSCMFYSFLQSL